MTDTSQKAKSQLAAIHRHLKTHGHIDMPTAWQEYGCAALRSRISDLRKQGVAIETKFVEFVSKFGHGGRYAVYHIQKS
jgi:Helix-turn-helix domain